VNVAGYDPNCAWYDFTCTKDPTGCGFFDFFCTAEKRFVAPAEDFVRNVVLIVVVGVVVVVGLIAFSPAGKHLIPRVSVR
jgi:hypothetical protein